MPVAPREPACPVHEKKRRQTDACRLTRGRELTLDRVTRYACFSNNEKCTLSPKYVVAVQLIQQIQREMKGIPSKNRSEYTHNYNVFLNDLVSAFYREMKSNAFAGDAEPKSLRRWMYREGAGFAHDDNGRQGYEAFCIEQGIYPYSDDLPHLEVQLSQTQQRELG
jgi:hypothetical protein